jgi:hypothetical protein
MLMVRFRQFAEPLQGKTQVGRKSSKKTSKIRDPRLLVVHALLGDKSIDAGAGESYQIPLFEMVKCASSLAPMACA